MAGSRAEPCAYRPGIDEFLAGYGFESTKAADKVDRAETRAREWFDCARVLAAHALPDDLLLFRDDAERDRARKKGLVVEPHHFNAAWLAVEPVRLALAAFGLSGKLDE